MTSRPDPEAFAVEYVRNNADGKAAALFAGYAETTAAHQVPRILAMPLVQARIGQELAVQRAVSGVIGLTVLQSIAKEEKAPAAARVTAARTLMEYAGMLGGKGDGGSSKDPSEMSSDELRDLIARLDRELGDRAKPVNAPIAPPVDDQVSDFL